ncbi:peptidase domain-containing ABC transporter [Jeongeupia chitinilytica]|uniref:Colicin V biosynthesis protein n=1 Tax=Jeongeupia chitinilytica TaxID=1041641 RepID=A0ABQ3H2B8_9NEIS|nr:peptidase domain-containing ABC transporter [Jeongeupia chitinilytica]GHD64305.1 colicin V biosynthesis protein [Jeongeupia chitinilytica]
MNLIDQLEWGWQKKLPMIHQTEAAECGVACIAMIAAWHGYKTDLRILRGKFNVTQHGMTLDRMIECVRMIDLAARPIRLELEELRELATPCILHWDLNHFVVLTRVKNGTIQIHDPARGILNLSLEETSKHFTGIALELTPTDHFEPVDLRDKIRLGHLVGRTRGLISTLGRILVFAGVLEALALTTPLFNQLVIDEVLVTRDTNLLIIVAIGMALLALTQGLIAMAREWALTSLSMSFGLQWAANVFHHLVRLPIEWFERRHLGDVSAKFRSIENIQRTLTTSTLEAILDTILLIGTLSMMFIYDVRLSLVAIGAAVLYGILRLSWFLPLRDAGIEAWTAMTKEESHFLESMRGILSLRINGATPRREVAWRNLMVDTRNAQLRQQRLAIGYHLCFSLLSRAAAILILWFGANAVLNGTFTVGMLIAFLALQDRFTTSANQLIDKFFEFKMLTVYTERLADIVLTPIDPGEKSQTATNERPQKPDESEIIAVKNLHFSYGENEIDVLTGVSFTLQRGEIVAVAGPSGCGKSTMLKILLGIYQPTRGEISIFGKSSVQGDLPKSRPRIGTVLQEDHLFSGSIFDNIALFAPRADVERVERCAQLAEIHNDIIQLPMGYHTLTGEMGSTLSGGQKQRVLLARALYKQPDLLFLDEATSHLDTDNEFRVNQMLRAMGITTLLIAHRPETIASADRVLVLSHGQIIEERFNTGHSEPAFPHSA